MAKSPKWVQLTSGVRVHADVYESMLEELRLRPILEEKARSEALRRQRAELARRHGGEIPRRHRRDRK